MLCHQPRWTTAWTQVITIPGLKTYIIFDGVRVNFFARCRCFAFRTSGVTWVIDAPGGLLFPSSLTNVVRCLMPTLSTFSTTKFLQCGFQNVLSNIFTTVTYKQLFIEMSTCCFVWADEEKLRAIQIHQTEIYFIGPTCKWDLGGVSSSGDF